MDIIAVWAIRLSQQPDLMTHEPLYVSRALEGMQAALESSSASLRLQSIQAEILFAMYFFCDGRLLEGFYHTAAAMTAAMSCRLHQIGERSSQATETASFVMPGNDLLMPVPHDATELGERIGVFWSAFFLDRCWSVALGCPPSLLDEHPPAMSIITPLPRRMEEYVNVSFSRTEK